MQVAHFLDRQANCLNLRLQTAAPSDLAPPPPSKMVPAHPKILDPPLWEDGLLPGQTVRRVYETGPWLMAYTVGAIFQKVHNLVEKIPTCAAYLHNRYEDPVWLLLTG